MSKNGQTKVLPKSFTKGACVTAAGGDRDSVRTSVRFPAAEFEKFVQRIARAARAGHRIDPADYTRPSSRPADAERVQALRQYAGVVYPHVPLHESSLERWGHNLHGHIHSQASPPGPYTNCCIEQCGGVPRTLEEWLGGPVPGRRQASPERPPSSPPDERDAP